MAASNKPGPIHFVAIGLFMLSIVLGVVAFLMHRDYKEAIARERSVQDELNTVQTDRTTKSEELTALKEVIGFGGMSNIGINDDENPETVIGAAKSSIEEFGKAFEAPSYNETVINMSAGITTLTKEKVQRVADYSELNKKFLELEDRHQSDKDILIEKKLEAEDKLKKEIAIKAEEVGKRDKQIKESKERVRELELEKATLRDDYDREIDKLSDDNEKLARINDDLRDKQYAESKLSFEIADGRITRVDHVVGLVWLNLGRADGLKPRTTFSVYQKDNQSVGRNVSDIKGTIEVVSILGAHESEARIVSDFSSNPIFRGDLIYTPIWEVGRVNKFSFVGLIDIDGDKRSDRDKLHEIVESSGGVIDNEVDDTGASTGKGLTVDTRFLVFGRIPDVREVLENEKPAIIAMQSQKVDYIKQARLNAVRIINLSEFLAFIGYHPSRRVWAPGEDSPFHLELGRRKTKSNGYKRPIPVKETSTGNYGTSRRKVKRGYSSGKTEKIFRSTRGTNR
jgi:hypothetical protein